MKKIVLVNPPYSFWSPDKNYLRPFIGTLPSLGFLSLAAVLRKRGYTVRIIESASLGLTFSQTVGEILREKPHYIGLNCTTASVGNAARIAEAVKAVDPHLSVFVGGPHITAIPEETFRRYASFDYGIAGEGEAAFPDLLARVEEGQELREVESAIFREGAKVIINPRRRLMEDLDCLPLPAYDLLPFFPQKYRPPLLTYPRGPVASLISSRGCPQVCTFCDRSVFGNRYRHFSEDYLMGLISHLHHRYGIRHLVFADDQFAAVRTRLLGFCEKLARAGLPLRWNCDARVDSVDSELLKIMKRAGCWMISYGIESGSSEILAGINKRIRLDQVEQAVRKTREAGIRAKGLFMIGSPQETESTLEDTLSLILRCPFDELNLSFLTPYPGTEIYTRVKGSPSFTEDWSRMNAMNCVFRPEKLGAGVLEKAYAQIIRRFYMRPRITFSYLNLLARSPDNCGRLAAGAGRWLMGR